MIPMQEKLNYLVQVIEMRENRTSHIADMHLESNCKNFIHKYWGHQLQVTKGYMSKCLVKGKLPVSHT